MIAVADSSPLFALINIGQVEILPKLFGHVTVPPEISRELRQSNRPQAVRDFLASPPQWLKDSRQ